MDAGKEGFGGGDEVLVGDVGGGGCGCGGWGGGFLVGFFALVVEEGDAEDYLEELSGAAEEGVIFCFLERGEDLGEGAAPWLVVAFWAGKGEAAADDVDSGSSCMLEWDL